MTETIELISCFALRALVSSTFILTMPSGFAVVCFPLTFIYICRPQKKNQRKSVFTFFYKKYVVAKIFK